MALRLPFFGLISMRSPIAGLLEHFEQINKGMDLVEDSITCYISDGDNSACKEFEILRGELDAVEDHADTIKRNLRNHLPRSIFLPVDRHVFFLYTREQDNILDSAQRSLQWLAMRDVNIPEEFKKDFIFSVSEVLKTVHILRPALDATVAWVQTEEMMREEIKQHFVAVRRQHKEASKKVQNFVAALYNSSMDFKDIFQLLHCLAHLQAMSHSAERCADLLRVMIAK